MDPLYNLIEVDKEIRRTLVESENPDKVKDWIKEMLGKAAADPGRAAKLRVTYILERMAEICKDLVENGPEGFWKRESDIMKWIDRGLGHTNYLLDPDSDGKFLTNFDQVLVKVEILDPKDPEAIQARRERAAALNSRWNQALASRSTTREPRRPGSGGRNLILPGM